MDAGDILRIASSFGELSGWRRSATETQVRDSYGRMLIRQRAPPSYAPTHRSFQNTPIPENPDDNWKSWYKMELQILSSVVKSKLEEFQPMES